MFICAFKLNLKRFWWVSALNAFLLLLFFIYSSADEFYLHSSASTLKTV